jgi:hypothetical protein
MHSYSRMNSGYGASMSLNMRMENGEWRMENGEWPEAYLNVLPMF